MSTVSIIPGIETAAPLRTETSSGAVVSPKPFPVADSRRRMFAATSFRRASLYDPVPRYSMQVLLASVNPGGTVMPMFTISARFAPLLPSTFFISRVPSA